RSDHARKTGRQLLHRNQAAPSDAAGEDRLARPEQAHADSRMDAVGADHVSRADGSTVRERRVDMSRLRGDRDASLVQDNGVPLARANRAGEQVMQIGAMQHEMRRAEPLHVLVAEIEPVPGFAGAPVPQLAPLRPNLNASKGRLQYKRKQNARAVGADLDTGADFLELARLFVDFDVDAALEQRKRRGQSANAGADDSDFSRR